MTKSPLIEFDFFKFYEFTCNYGGRFQNYLPCPEGAISLYSSDGEHTLIMSGEIAKSFKKSTSSLGYKVQEYRHD